MKKKYIIFLLLTMFLMPFEVFAEGGFGVSNTNVSMYVGESKTVTITTDNAVGKLNIISSNSDVASVSPSSIFIQNPGSSGSITIKSNSIGTATISVVASNDFATMDEEILVGTTKTIVVNVIEKETTPSNPTPSTPTPKPSTPTPQKPQVSLSSNNNIESLNVVGYELVKVDDNNYTLTVTNDVSSIEISATLEDEKASVNELGVKELEIGENNFEVIVTAENGDENIINIKVTRKDGYYLEDLDLVLSKDELQDVDIIINIDSVITKDQLEKIKNSKKKVHLNYYDDAKKLIYSWIIDGKSLNEVNDFITTITFTTENMEDINRLSNYAYLLYANFKDCDNIPKGASVKLYVGDNFNDGSIVNIYNYNINDKKIDFVKDNVKVLEGYITFDVSDCKDYIITMSTIKDVNKDSLNIPIIILVVSLIIIIGVVVFMLIKKRKMKSNNMV